MTAVGPDEKVCPYCAEVIKAAAIKCRFCHSDLPVEEPADIEPVETLLPDVEPVETPPAGPRLRIAGPRDRVLLGLIALCVVLAGVFVTLVLVSRPGDLETADNGQVTDAEFRSAAMSTASADAATVLSYSYKTLEQDQKAALDVLTPKFREEYEEVMKTTGAKATTAKLTQKATVATSSLISITETKASVLLFVDTVTTAEGSTGQQLSQYRVKMKLERKDGDWAVSDMMRF